MHAQSGFVNAEPAGAAAATQPIPGHTLFDSTSVAIATFLGSPLAGTGLMALNYRRMGEEKQRNRSIRDRTGGNRPRNCVCKPDPSIFDDRHCHRTCGRDQEYRQTPTGCSRRGACSKGRRDGLKVGSSRFGFGFARDTPRRSRPGAAGFGASLTCRAASQTDTLAVRNSTRRPIRAEISH